MRDVLSYFFLSRTHSGYALSYYSCEAFLRLPTSARRQTHLSVRTSIARRPAVSLVYRSDCINLDSSYIRRTHSIFPTVRIIFADIKKIAHCVINTSIYYTNILNNILLNSFSDIP